MSTIGERLSVFLLMVAVVAAVVGVAFAVGWLLGKMVL